MTIAQVQHCMPAPRTDADVKRDVETGLSWCACEPPGAIEVAVEAGWVTLTGRVESPRHKQAAADSLRYLLGVTGVSDRLTIDDSHGEPLRPGVTL